jgi:hypothetical protein
VALCLIIAVATEGANRAVVYRLGLCLLISRRASPNDRPDWWPVLASRCKLSTLIRCVGTPGWREPRMAYRGGTCRTRGGNAYTIKTHEVMRHYLSVARPHMCQTAIAATCAKVQHRPALQRTPVQPTTTLGRTCTPSARHCPAMPRTCCRSQGATLLHRSVCPALCTYFVAAFWPFPRSLLHASLSPY